MPDAVEELFRAYPVGNTNRTIGMNLEFHGVKMRKGDNLVLPTVLAGRDPLAFDNPHNINIGRKPRYLTFGTGVHKCLGIQLAKLEMRTVISEMLSRFESIKIAAGKDLELQFGAKWCIKYLPLILD